jgi:carotenoid cleavage dioxygenase-like enzyme
VGNVFLDGNFAPVREEWTATDLAVTGHIPEFLDGRYLRNGPNPAGEVDPEAYPWFTGDGMVHGIRIRDGRAEWYRNRWVRSPGMAALLKHDLERRTTVARSFGAGRELGEFVFVPRHDDAAEDDGVLMGLVYDPATDRSDLALLDAAGLDTIASIHLPTRVPNGFHGNWVPDSQ